MPNAADTYASLRHLAHARVNLVHIASFEWERVRGLAIGLTQGLGVPLFVWSRPRGADAAPMGRRRARP